MVEIPLLRDIVVIFGCSILVIFICNKIRIPSIVGFLITGVFIGPHTLGLVNSIHEVEVLAEVGIVLLLFTIGIEFSFKKLLQARKSVLLGGTLQVVLTAAATYLIATRFGAPTGGAVFIGFLIALSSTAIVLRIFQERAELDSPHGRNILSVLIFQDIVIVPMIIFTPMLAGGGGEVGASLLVLIIKGVAIVAVVILGAKYLIPGLMYQIVRTRSREMFLLSIVLICIAVAWITSRMGLSLGLGAFLAGLIISESEYNYQALEGILPFRDVFTSFFFVSVGMLLNTAFVINHPLLILALALAVLATKTFMAAVVGIVLGLSIRSAVMMGLALCQVGEFSFILSKVGMDYNLLGADIYQGFIAISIFSMAATPFIIARSSLIGEFVSNWGVMRRLKSRLVYERKDEADDKIRSMKDHLIIVGFGINGRNVARAARTAGIEYIIIEMNPDTVKQEQQKGEPIFYGDAAGEDIYKKARIGAARVLVIAISDPISTRRATEIARRLSHSIHIIVRTRFVQEMKPLYDLGASEVIPEEFETSVEIFTLVLMKYLLPREEIEQFIKEVRLDNYQMFRSLSRRTSSISDLKLHLSDIDVCSLRIASRAKIVGQTLGQVELRKKYGITVLAIERKDEIISNPDASTEILSDDIIFVLGTADQIKAIASLIQI